jgi:hypothetical protein
MSAVSKKTNYNTELKTTEQYLLEIHGPLMTFEAVATILHRTRAAIRNGINTNQAWARPLVEARKNIGGRILFRTSAIAEMIDSN